MTHFMEQQSLNKKGFLLGSLFFIALTSFIPFSCQSASSSESTSKVSSIADTIPVSKKVATADTLAKTSPPDTTPITLEIIGVGDMMLGTNYPSASYLPANGGNDLLKDVESVLKGADVTFGNLEGTLLDEGGTVKRCSNPSLCYAFRSPESYINHYTNAGFDLLSIANNHSGDFGPEGRRRTKAILKEAGIGYAGLAGSDEMTIIERKGVKIGMCAFAPNVGTCDIRNISYATGIVKKLAEQVDIVIVSFHGGAEGTKNQNVPRRTETYYGENRGDVYKFSRAVIDAGADIVFGHGPHVTRAADLYKDRFIIYSLGNFCTYGRFNLRGAAGIAPIISLKVDATGKFLGGKAIPIYQQKTHGPKIDPQNRAIDKLIELTKQDFPETALAISEDGTLSKK